MSGKKTDKNMALLFTRRIVAIIGMVVSVYAFSMAFYILDLL
jgi:hypothetical protein